jgi:hypothetical protein
MSLKETNMSQTNGEDNKELRRFAEEKVKILLEQWADPQAKLLGKTVGGDADKWWTSHYVKSFFFALAAKDLTKGNLEDAMDTMQSLAMVLGRASATFAEQDKKAEIDAGHAAQASRVVDCPILSAEEQARGGLRAEWCN